MVVLTIEKLATEILEILLLVFTYIIPLFSTIRAIHNQEKSSFQQWLTYWLLINIINPFFRFFRFHPLIHLMTVLYLSLPKFQGALHIYHELIEFDSVMERYGVEDKVDGQIKHVKKSLKTALWNIAKDIGWGTMCQIGEIVSLIQGNDTKEPDSVYDPNAQSSIEEDEASDQEDYQERDVANDDTSDYAARKQPLSQTVAESLDSESSVDLNSEEAEYLEDFVTMLKKGLYVFAYHTKIKSVESSTAESLEKGNTDEARRFRLRNFCFQPGETDGENNSGAYFVLRPVESASSSNDEESFKVPLSSVDEVRKSGTNGIQFLSIKPPPVSPSNSISDPTSCENSLVTSPSMVTISSFRSNHIEKDNADTEKQSADESEHVVVLMEISLSEESDCSTMLKGFQLFVANLSSNETLDHDGNEDKRGEDNLNGKENYSDNGEISSYANNMESKVQPIEKDSDISEGDKNESIELNRDLPSSNDLAAIPVQHTSLTNGDIESEAKHQDEIDQSSEDNSSNTGEKNSLLNDGCHGHSSFNNENESLGDESCDVVDWTMSSPKQKHEAYHDNKLSCEQKDNTKGRDTDLEYTALPENE